MPANTPPPNRQTHKRMTQEEEQTLHLFETRVRQLLLQYELLREENRQLQEACADTERRLEAAISERQAARKELEQLKLAKMMAISNEDLAHAKQRIEQLIRKVDKCIALMGV